jgi:hypothetical protein
VIVIVISGYVRLGLEGMKASLSAGVTVLEKAATNLVGLNVEISSLNLLDPTSIDIFAERLLSSGRPLQFLTNNVGIMVNLLFRDSRI